MDWFLPGFLGCFVSPLYNCGGINNISFWLAVKPPLSMQFRIAPVHA